MTLKNFTVSAVLAAACFIMLGTTPAYAFKSKTHIILANAVLADAQDGRLSIPGLSGLVDMGDSELLEALTTYPKAFRAGVLGPDNYPDLIGGQVWVHANNGDNLSDQATKFENRKLSNWRSIDYGMYQLKQARLFDVSRAERLKAIAYAYGYLAHMVQDGFAHTYVNEWAGGAWDIKKGDGTFGPQTQELKHLGVEGLLDTMLPTVSDAALDIEAPVRFLDFMYRHDVLTAGGQKEKPGAFAGRHIEVLLEVRDKLRRVVEDDDYGGTFGKLGELAVDAERAADLAGLPNPMSDVKWFLQVRADMLDEIVANLPLLSDCIAQNIVLGQNRKTPEPLATDACEAIDFEPPGSLARFIFNGDLNNVAKKSDGEDAGSFAANVDRLYNYFLLVLTEGLAFSPARDIESIGEIRRKVNVCQEVFEWGGCEKACDAADRLCVKAINRTLCFGCPSRGGDYNCTKNWKLAARCTFLDAHGGNCWACDQLPLWQELTNDACSHGTNVAAPVCELCRPRNSLCAASESINTLNEFIGGPIDEAVNEALAPLEDLALDAIKAVVFGRYYDQAQNAIELYDRRKARGKAVWLVNATFFPEDLRAGGRPYLMRLFNKALGVPPAAMSATQSAAAFAQSTWGYATQPSPVGDKIIWGKEGDHTDDFAVYTNFIKFLYGLTDGSSEAVLKDEVDYWANRVKTQKQKRHNVTVNFVSLLDALGLLHSLAGPTATALAEDMAAQSFDPEHIEDVAANLSAFPATFNALQLTKLSIVSDAKLDQQFGTDLMAGRSQICQSYPHIMCDSIATLDDPNHHGPDSSPDSISPAGGHVFSTLSGFPAAGAFDAERSVSAWAPRKILWAPHSVGPSGPCIAAKTAFPLAGSSSLIAKKYEKIFMAPDHCPPTWFTAAMTTLLQ
jgi:hypothetical protein